MSEKQPRWTGIEARGKRIYLTNGDASWMAIEAEGAAHADHVVKELEHLINHRVDRAVKSAEYNRLCRAGD